MIEFDPKKQREFEEERKIEIEASTTLTTKDYDDAMEEYILRVRTERGYTLREPSPFYDNDENPRWASDAAVFKKFRHDIMMYGLQIQNDYAEGKPVPSLEEFKAALENIKCEWMDD